MYVQNTRYKIEIIAISDENGGYAVEVTGDKIDSEQYTVGPNNSISRLVKRICDRLEFELPVVTKKKQIIDLVDDLRQR